MTELSAGSRVKAMLAGNSMSLSEMLLARNLDAMNTLVWFKTKDGHKHRNRPKSVFEALSSIQEGRKEGKKKKEVQAFDSGASFSDYWKKNGGC